MHNHRFVRRVAAAAMALSVGVVPLVSASNAHADEITDLQTRADQISAQMTQLNTQIAADTAKYEEAQYAQQQIDAKISQASRQLAAAKRNESSSRRDLADYALNAYVNGGSGSVDLAALLNTDGDQIGPRQGYESTAVGDRQELVDQLQAAQRVTSERAATLADQRHKAEEVTAQAKSAKDNAEAAQQELSSLQSQVKGRLGTLVAERQAAQDRARQEQARQAAQRLSQQQAASVAAAPQRGGVSGAAPSVSAPSNPTPAPIPEVPATDGAPATPVPYSGRGGAAVAAAASMLGVPYVWGGSSPSGFDCSGLTMWAWAQAGVSLPRVTYSQRYAGQVVPLDQIQPGDLVFYYGFGHVALYAGGGSIIHAPHTGDVVRYASLYMSTPILVVRPG